MSTESTPIWAIVPASGLGERMRGQVPKQYLQLCGKSILEHTLDRLMSSEDIAGLILVLRPGDRYWKALDYQAQKPLIIATGGNERQQSVLNGLSELPLSEQENPLIMVHDAVRPLVSHQDIKKLHETALSHAAGAILGVTITDTLKRQDNDGNIALTVPRDGLWRAYTPQAFRVKLLSRALTLAIKNQLEITDDASAVEALGMAPKLVAGNAENIKITHPQDIALATQIMRRQQIVKR